MKLFARLREQQGVGAILLVVGASLVILVIVAAIASQSRQDLRMAAAERDAAQVRAQVTGVFQYAAARATDINWPGVPGDPGAEAVDGRAPCTPTTPAVSGQPYPVYCRQFLQRREVSVTEDPGIVYEIPVRVRWQVSADGPTEDTFGWILTDLPVVEGEPLGVRGVFYYHRPCTLEPDYIDFGPCKQGS